MTRRTVLLLTLLAFCLLAQNADVSGTWTFEVSTSAGSGNPTFVFRQEGSRLTGSYSGVLGEFPVTGTVEGKTLKFAMNVEAQGEKFVVRYQGTVEAADQLKGTAEYGPLGEATWTARKQK